MNTSPTGGRRYIYVARRWVALRFFNRVITQVEHLAITVEVSDNCIS